ncbi:MAG: FecR domain-containing protein [Rhodocyclaceae bacterium]|nr:FecR domain-containing protein [Rhodocyclaceae bacterium]
MTAQPFRHSIAFAFMVFLAAALLGLPALAVEAGSISNVAGTVRIIAADGTTIAAVKGSPLHAGDLLETAPGGHADLRFSDGGIVMLRPRSRFRIDRYFFSGKGDGDQGLFSLLRGSFRTATGLLGKLRHSSYAVTAPTATIGIRGTQYSATVDDKGLAVSVERGEISLTNRSGSYTVSAGQRARVASQEAAPVYSQTGAAEGGGSAGGSRGNVRLQGNTRVEANQHNAAATATGTRNQAGNAAGVIGGE